MSPPGSATHAIATAILNNNFGLKANDYSVAPGNEAQLAQFLSQKEIDAGVLRSVTLAQIQEIKPRRLASVVDEWKKLTKGNAPPILAVTIVYNDYLAKNREAVAKFIAATSNALQFGSKNKGRVAEILQKSANMNAADAQAYANQWDGAYIASCEPGDINSLKKMYDIVKAAGVATKDPPESAFDTDPFMRAKNLK
jgi:NitT/TauT family transport system substrate-binding protein